MNWRAERCSSLTSHLHRIADAASQTLLKADLQCSMTELLAEQANPKAGAASGVVFSQTAWSLS
jgi:hypothetical protein